MRHDFRLQTAGGWGYVDPAPFAFDLLKGAAWNLAKKSGVIRLGKAPSSGNDDTRPIISAYRHVFKPAWVSKGNVQNLFGDSLAALESTAAVFGGAAGLHFTDGKLENPHAFGLPITLGFNESFAFRGFVFPVDGAGKEPKGHIWQARIGAAGEGVLFQIRDGNPEIARLSPQWTREGENQLRALWALDSPTSAEETQIETLKTELYSSFDSLCFDGGGSRDKWRGELFFLTFIPDPRGALHLILEGGGGVTQIEFPDLLETRDIGKLWSGSVEVGATGGAWIFQPQSVRFGTGTMEFGPYLIGGDPGELQTSASSYSTRDENGDFYSGVTVEKVDYTVPPEGDSSLTPFKLRATLESDDARYPAWLFALSTRLENGTRTGLADNEITFNSEDLGEGNDVEPVLEVEVSLEEDGSRQATVTMRDVNGRTLDALPGGFDSLVGRVANLTKNGAPLFTQALITRGRLSDVKCMAVAVPSGPRRLPIDVSKAETTAEVTLCDGRAICRETLCQPPPISDGKHLGFALRQRYRLAGFSNDEMARTPENFGPLLPTPAPGEDWAVVADENDDVDSSCEALMDRFGLYLRRYMDENGVWVLERRPTNIVANFFSSASKNDPNLLRGGTRHMILDGFDWERGGDFYNIFRVIGGRDGREIIRDYVDEHSMKLAPTGVHSRWVGRPIPYPTLRDSGLRTVANVELAKRSLIDRYNNPPRFAQFESYYEGAFWPRDRVTLDGVLCEVMSWQSTGADDAMQIRVREVA